MDSAKCEWVCAYRLREWQNYDIDAEFEGGFKLSTIGLVIPYWNDITKDEIIDFAQLVEGLGYDSIWVPEMWGRDAFSILSVIALNTKRIKLGTGIVSVFSRTPAIIAQTIATLDEFSEGRVILGLGTSGPVVIENWHGVNFDQPLRRTREYVEIIRMIISGQRVNYEGDIFKLKNFSLQFKPFREVIPIYIASIGPKNMMLTGEIADGWIPFLVPIEHYTQTGDYLRAGAEEGGRQFDNIKVCPYIPALVSDDEDASRRLIKEYVAFYIGAMGTYYSGLIRRYGFQDEANSIVEAWKKGSKEEAIKGVSDSLLNSVAITGSANAGKIKMEEFRKAGADIPIIIFPPKASRDLVKQTINNLSP
ncbi:MAG: LLM class flavin-dependent oxidoreductase [Thermodesulfobacteriota bacterium]